VTLSDWRREAAHLAALIHGQLNEWHRVSQRYPLPPRDPLPDPGGWRTLLLERLKCDADFYDWTLAHVFTPLDAVDVATADAPQSVATIRNRLQALHDRLTDGGPASALVWEADRQPKSASRQDKNASKPQEGFASQGLITQDSHDLQFGPNPPWESVQWPRPTAAGDTVFMPAMAAGLEQAAEWVTADTHGPRWLTMLRDLARHLDRGCNLPAHARVLGIFSEQWKGLHIGDRTVEEAQREQAILRASFVDRLHALAGGMRFYVERRQPRPARAWNAPTSWGKEAQDAAHAIGEEIERVSRFCAAWAHFGVPAGHPCQELDCAPELWSRDWLRPDQNSWLRANCRVSEWKRHWDVLGALFQYHVKDRLPVFEQIQQATNDHNAQVEAQCPARTIGDSDESPPFHSWSLALDQMATHWRIGVVGEVTGTGVVGQSNITSTSVPAPSLRGMIDLQGSHPVAHKRGPAAVLRVLLKDPIRPWSARGLAMSDDMADAGGSGNKPAEKSVRRWLALLKNQALAQVHAEEKTWTAGPACWR